MASGTGADTKLMKSRIIVVALAVAAVMVPAAAVAKPGHGKGHEKHHAKTHGKKAKKPKRVMFVFKGTFTGPDTVTVVAGNSHVRKGGFVGQTVTFDFADARVVGADTNGDQKVDVTDVADGDAVLVQARVARRTKFEDGAPSIVARKLVDKTKPPVEDEDDTGDDAPTP
jgi:opacity protein-like surface antigen